MKNAETMQTAPFAIPAEYEASSWATEILGPLRAVALDYQLAYAESLASDWEAEGSMVRPVGPSLDDLREMLADENEAAFAEALDGGPAEAWPAWTDADLF